MHDNLRLLADCNLYCVSLVTRQNVIDGLADPDHAAILTMQSAELSLQAFILLAEELQQSAILHAQESYLQASAQPLADSAGPKLEPSNTPVKDEEVISETGGPTETNDLLITRCWVDEETHPKRHQGTCAQLDDIGVRRNAGRLELCLSAT